MAKLHIAASTSSLKACRATGDQMRLLDLADRSWELDERTRQIGRLGLRQAREALRRAQPDQAA
ncbi:MAG: hypothetical protein ACRD1K_12025 [Acidimicrobiales bacterium]